MKKAKVLEDLLFLFPAIFLRGGLVVLLEIYFWPSKVKLRKEEEEAEKKAEKNVGRMHCIVVPKTQTERKCCSCCFLSIPGAADTIYDFHHA